VSGGDPSPQLERLPGVVAATSFLNPSTPPLVYLATTPDADRDGLRPLVVALLRDHGHETPPDRIHFGVAPDRSATPAPPLPRVSLDSLDVSRREARVECTVRLRAAERQTEGSASEPDTPSGPPRAAARATLLAAERLDPDYRFGLEGVRVLDLFGEAIVVVMVDARAGRSQAHLPGSALLDRPVEEATALATLHALRGWAL
jgi:hypothetical protein